MAQLKANGPTDSTSAIVISFDAKWKDSISNNSLSVVFRKRGPKSPNLEWIYFYVSAPYSAIIGRGKIDKYESMPIHKALGLFEKGGLSQKELKEYAEGYEFLAVFSLATIETSENPIPLAQLTTELGFKPPQSFVIMSKNGKKQLDKSLGF